MTTVGGAHLIKVVLHRSTSQQQLELHTQLHRKPTKLNYRESNYYVHAYYMHFNNLEEF